MAVCNNRIRLIGIHLLINEHLSEGTRVQIWKRERERERKNKQLDRMRLSQTGRGQQKKRGEEEEAGKKEHRQRAYILITSFVFVRSPFYSIVFFFIDQPMHTTLSVPCGKQQRQSQASGDAGHDR